MRLLPAVAGDIIKVKKADLEVEAAIMKGDLHGEIGDFPPMMEYVRYIEEIVVAGEDYTGKLQDELSMKKGDFIIPLYADDKDFKDKRAFDGFYGLPLVPGTIMEGWFESYRADLLVYLDGTIFSEERYNRKRRLMDARVEFIKALKETDLLECKKMIPNLLECAKNAKQDGFGDPQYGEIIVLQQAPLVLYFLGDYEGAYELAVKRFKALTFPEVRSSEMLAVAFLDILRFCVFGNDRAKKIEDINQMYYSEPLLKDYDCFTRKALQALKVKIFCYSRKANISPKGRS